MQFWMKNWKWAVVGFVLGFAHAWYTDTRQTQPRPPVHLPAFHASALSS